MFPDVFKMCWFAGFPNCSMILCTNVQGTLKIMISLLKEQNIHIPPAGFLAPSTFRPSFTANLFLRIGCAGADSLMFSQKYLSGVVFRKHKPAGGRRTTNPKHLGKPKIPKKTRFKKLVLTRKSHIKDKSINQRVNHTI